MLGIDLWEFMLIGVVALVVLGPERLPRAARTIGALVGKAQRYVNEVKAEVNRAIDLEELQKMKSSVETQAREFESSVNSTLSSTAADFEKTWAETTQGISSYNPNSEDPFFQYPAYTRPKKNWRVKRGTTPVWYKRSMGIKRQALSGAARVAKHRPKNRSIR